MAERFSRLFSLPENLYATDSPIVIAAGALLKDTQTGKVLAQLKLRSISEKKIKAVKIKIRPLDTVNNPLGDEIEYQYLDLSISRDEEFGQKNGITLANAATRAYSPEVTEVDFEDNSVWLALGDTWDSIPAPQEIGDKELTKQYRMRYGESAQYKPMQFKDLWICTCGAFNKNGQSTCYRCSNEIERLLACDWEELTAAKDQRLAEEKAKQEAKIAADNAAKAATAKRKKKLLTIAISAIAICIGTWLLFSKVVIPNARYNQAIKYAEAGQYQEAIVTFQSLGDYKDSTTQIEKARKALIEAENAAKYERGMLLLSNGDYDGAISIFTQLGNYKNSAKKLGEAKSAKAEVENAAAYEKALALLSAGEYDKAINAFTKLGSYQDSAKKLEEAKKAKKEVENNTAYKNASALLDAKNYDDAIAAFTALGDYQDSAEQVNEAKYQWARSLLAWGNDVNYDNIAKSHDLFAELGNYKDSKEYLVKFLLRPTSCYEKWQSKPTTVAMTYDEYGNIRSSRFGSYAYKDGCLEITGGEDYNSHLMRFDDNGRLIYIKYLNADYHDHSEIYYNYILNQNGTIQKIQTKYKKSGTWKTKIIYSYNGDGRIKEIEYVGVYLATYYYNSYGLSSVSYYYYYDWKDTYEGNGPDFDFQYEDDVLSSIEYDRWGSRDCIFTINYIYAPKGTDLYFPMVYPQPITYFPFNPIMDGVGFPYY